MLSLAERVTRHRGLLFRIRSSSSVPTGGLVAWHTRQLVTVVVEALPVAELLDDVAVVDSDVRPAELVMTILVGWLDVDVNVKEVLVLIVFLHLGRWIFHISLVNNDSLVVTFDPKVVSDDILHVPLVFNVLFEVRNLFLFDLEFLGESHHSLLHVLELEMLVVEVLLHNLVLLDELLDLLLQVVLVVTLRLHLADVLLKLRDHRGSLSLLV